MAGFIIIIVIIIIIIIIVIVIVIIIIILSLSLLLLLSLSLSSPVRHLCKHWPVQIEVEDCYDYIWNVFLDILI